MWSHHVNRLANPCHVGGLHVIAVTARNAVSSTLLQHVRGRRAPAPLLDWKIVETERFFVSMRFRVTVLFSVCAFGHSQTLVDLRTQSKSVDFTAASTTKPLKTGTSLPAACGVGEAFFNTNAPAGSNFYLCTSQNSWTLQAGTPGPQGPAGPQGPGGPAGPAGANGAIAHVQSAGSTLPVEGILNFTGGGCTDDASNGRTNCSGAGISGLNIDVNGSAQGSQSTLNFISASGIIQACSNNSGSSRVDCTPALDTAFAVTRATDQAGTDHSIVATSGGAGVAYVASGNPTFLSYTQNQTLSLIASDHACAAGATINIDGLGPLPLKKLLGGALVNVGSGDCLQNVPILLRAFGSPVTAFVLTPEGAPSTGWVSNVTLQSASLSAITLASAPTAGGYRLTYYVDQNGLCTSGSNSVVLAFNWTDASAARTLTTTSLALGTSQGATGFQSGTLPIWVGSGNVTYSSTVSGSCSSGTSSYDVHTSLERLQ